MEIFVNVVFDIFKNIAKKQNNNLMPMFCRNT